MDALTVETVVADLFWNALPKMKQPPPSVRLRERNADLESSLQFCSKIIEEEIDGPQQAGNESDNSVYSMKV